MKKAVVYLLLTIALAGCESAVRKTSKDPKPLKEQVRHNEPKSDADSPYQTIVGKVESINFGKDGYTAGISSADGIYSVTISRANLNDPQSYKEVAVGDTIEVTGEIWKLANENRVTARDVKY